MKQTHGWWKLSHMWLSRNLSGHIITPPRDIVPHIFADWLMAVEMKERAFGSVAPHTMSVVVASDFHVLATMAELRGLRQAATIPFLHGLLITKQELQDYMNNRSPQASDAGVAPPHMMLTKLQEDTAMVKDLVLGIGPDQSGSRPLAYLLGLQLEFSDWEASGEKSVLSYLTPVACEAVVGALLAQVKCKTRDTTSVSVHSAWLCHVDSILERWPGNTKVIIVERAQEEVVSSLLEIAGNTCCWMEHDGTVFDHDEYADAIYPKFEMHEIDATATWQSLSLSADTRRRFTKAAAEMYVDWYRAKATELAGRHPDNVKMLPVSELLAGGESHLAVLTWLGIAYPVVESVLQYPTTSYPGSPSITADTLPPPMVDTMTWPPAVTCEGLQGLLSQHVPLTPLPSVCDNVGILAIEPYIPMLSVKQTEMEIVDGVSPGKYTIGLGQKSVACCSEAEDAVSMVLTAVATLVRRTGITADRIGYVVVAGESMVDKAKPVATRLLRLEVFGGRVDAEVFDVQAACASGTIGLLQACRWAESYNAGRHGNGQKSIAIVAMSDIMLYPPGPARPTSGAGAVAMLVGCNAPLRVDLSHLVSHARDENDFLKFQLASEYATVNGEHSKKCYLDTLEHCAKSLASVVCADADVGCGASSSPLLDRVSRVCVHSPYHGITRKAAQRLGCTIGDTGALDCKRFDQLMAGGAMLGKETGNACSASLFLALVSTVRELSLDHVGERILMYSYGSGLSASMFETEIRNPQAGEFKLCDLQQSAEDSISQLLIDRVEVSPQDFVSIIDSLEGRSRDITQGLSWSCPDRVRVRKSTWYLAECDGRGDRRYECL